jgi:hypothetical protein
VSLRNNYPPLRLIPRARTLKQQRGALERVSRLSFLFFAPLPTHKWILLFRLKSHSDSYQNKKIVGEASEKADKVINSSFRVAFSWFSFVVSSKWNTAR